MCYPGTNGKKECMQKETGALFNVAIMRKNMVLSPSFTLDAAAQSAWSWLIIMQRNDFLLNKPLTHHYRSGPGWITLFRPVPFICNMYC